MGKARRFNQYDNAVKNVRDMKISSGLALHKASTFGSSQSSVLIGQRGTGAGQNRDQDKLPIRGGLLLGSIGFESNTRAISAGVLDLGTNAAGGDTLVKGIVFMTPESGDTDTLDRITGKERDGQLLFLTGVQNSGASPTRTYTITHNAGGVGTILCPDDTDYTLLDDETVTLLDDVTGIDTWRLISTSDSNNLGTGIATSTWKNPVVTSTTTNITLSGEQTLDGILTSADRVLVKNQTAGAENGIYVSAAGAWVRSTDLDTSVEAVDGVTVFVEQGTTKADTIWQITTNNPITLDTTSIIWTEIVGGAADNLGNHTATQDIDFATFDGIQVDRLRFVTSSGSVASAGDPSILIDTTGDMQFNVATGDGHFWTINNVISVQDDLTKLEKRTAGNDIPRIQTFRNDPSPAASNIVAEFRGLGTDSGGSTAVNYGSMIVVIEDTTIGAEDGSLSFETVKAGSAAAFLKLNENNDDKIKAFKDIDVNTQDIINTDRLLFTPDSGAFAASSDVGILADASGDMRFNIATSDSHIFTINAVQSLANNVTILEKRTAEAAIPKIQTYRNDLTPAASNVIGNMRFLGNNATPAEKIYADIVGVIEDTTIGAEDGSLSFEVIRAGAPASFLKLNESNNGQINAKVNLNMGNFDLLVNGPGLINSETIQNTVDGAADEILFWDATVNALRKTIINNLPGSSAQTPWTGDIDADGFDLKDISNVEFRTTTGVPAGTVRYINVDADNMIFNVPSGDGYLFKENNVTQIKITSGGQLNLNGKNLQEALTLQSNTANIATAGFLRMANNEDIAWRNAANNNNLLFTANAQDKFEFSINGTIQYNMGATAMDFGGHTMENFIIESHTDANRGAAGSAGKIIFNTDDGQLNIDDGTNWTLPDGTTT